MWGSQTITYQSLNLRGCLRRYHGWELVAPDGIPPVSSHACCTQWRYSAYYTAQCTSSRQQSSSPTRGVSIARS
jgi:hypothetical protein